jgi:hypothetical protein
MFGLTPSPQGIPLKQTGVDLPDIHAGGILRILLTSSSMS